MAKRWDFDWTSLVLPVVVVASVTGTPVAATAQTPAARPVTFTKHIAPLLQRSCQRCHRPDSVAPMSLLTYAEARPYARAMKQRTALKYAPWMRGVMPPWFLETNVGIQKMKDDPSLSDAEIALFAAWADSGAPEGDPADLPPPLTFAGAAEWALGKPDLIVSSPSVFMPAVQSDRSGPIGASEPTALTEDRYTASAEFKEVPETDLRSKGVTTLGGRFVFHHAIVTDEDHNSGRLHLNPHEVGRNGEVYPPEVGLLLRAHARASFNAHLHSAGTDRSAHLDLGFKFRPRGFTPRYKIDRAPRSPTTVRDIQINPLAANQRIESYWVAQENVKLLNFEPHLHATGVRMCMRAINGVNGQSIETLSCAGYDHNWVRNYQYDDNWAPLLPKGTIIQTIAWFDNTPVNKNVLDPRNLSKWGLTSVANMFLTFNSAAYLTDEQYQEEIAKRREYLRRAGEEPIGCPDCHDKVAPPNYLPPPSATGGSR